MTDATRKALITVLFAGLAPLLAGCGEINDMLDAGAAGGKPKTEQAKGDSNGSTGAQSAREKLDAYYNREPRKVEQDPNDPIVPCNLRGRTQFMRKSDCVLRGGSPT